MVGQNLTGLEDLSGLIFQECYLRSRKGSCTRPTTLGMSDIEGKGDSKK
jgi:hypothetical protein